MVERSLVFTRFKVEKDRSAEQDVMGIAKAIPYTRTSVGYAYQLELFVGHNR